MTVTSLDKDLDHLTLTLVADFGAPVERVWRLWADPRQLERWWGPPSFPATVEEHDLTPGGDVTYYMTGPQGEKYRGWWRVATVDEPRSLEFTDGFADEHGVPNAAMPTTANRVTLTEHDGGTRLEMRAVFDTREQMDQLMSMGMDEGMREAAGQMDALVTAG
ncbi:SRPBCC family protein [Streptomyces ardesiacus]|uniref:SRPBCC family protein n=1 Tax=Streptomyces ardesiacus TaxID=285564 RepID=UPI0013C08D23|nr:SRPBCC domain-containing protein [Streptomyces ardesiacus]MCL7366148.1 SRPBCC domain-containing protein [Streptomyces ardesiacus]NEB63569.1 SRPBCC domain-containing protein [Streptomyces diastaticus]